MDAELKRLVWTRAGRVCEYCKLPQAYDPLPFQIDHIVAIQHQGWTAEDNLALACYACNHHKGPNLSGYDLVESKAITLFHPRRDAWDEHFRWNGPELTGLTATGRVTIHVLSINRDYRVALRRTLIDEGVF